jgi:cobalt-zinc-cadmium efflux system protein
MKEVLGMGLGHDHSLASGRSRALALALAITASFTVVEVVGGVLTGSLAVLADAVHMLSDNVALALALVALWLAAKPATPERTYGYKRAEVLAALANGVALVALAIWIFVEAIRSRSICPPGRSSIARVKAVSTSTRHSATSSPTSSARSGSASRP